MFGLLKNLFTSADNGELTEAIKRGAFLVDVRTPAEFMAGGVEGAVNIPVSEVEGKVEKFRQKKAIVVFCRSGNRSAQAKSILERNGVGEVLNGGSWRNVARAIKHKDKEQ